MADPVRPEDSIFLTIKQMLGGLDPTYDSDFDLDMKMHINASLATLTQVGVGPAEGFEITDENETWEQFLGNDKRLNLVKTFIYYDVKLGFDVPRQSFTINALKEKRDEYLWRINVQVDPGDPT